MITKCREKKKGKNLDPSGRQIANLRLKRLIKKVYLLFHLKPLKSRTWNLHNNNKLIKFLCCLLQLIHYHYRRENKHVQSATKGVKTHSVMCQKLY